MLLIGLGFITFFFIVKADDTNEKNVLISNEILFIGHRGASNHSPEHTFHSYDLAIDQNADYLEIDLQRTKDGELVAFHDRKVDRTTNGKGYVLDYTWAQLKELDAGSWFYKTNPTIGKPKNATFTVPSLNEIIERYKNDTNYYIETKFPEENPGMEEELIDLLDQHGLLDSNQPVGKVVIQSYSIESLKLIREKNEEIPLILLKKFNGKADVTQAEIDGIKIFGQGIGVNYQSLNQDFIDKIKSNDLLIHAYIVNDADDLAELRGWGIDGVFTDDLSIREKH